MSNEKNLLIKSSCGSFSTFFGGNATDEIKGVCRNKAGNVFITGITASTDLPVNSGLAGDSLNGGTDAFVAAFDSCGVLLWATYVGSDQDDGGEKILCTSDSCLIICGHSSGNNFPVSGGAYQTTKNGGYDAFLMKMTFSGQVLWSTYAGGNGGDLAYDLAIDKGNNVYIGGSTSSTDLPSTSISLQQNPGGSMDAFVMSFSAGGNFRWCTYFGGSGAEDVHVMCSDKSGHIYLGGGTFSNNINMGSGAWQPFNNGGMEIYLLKIDSSGNKLWSTYFGELGLDDCYGMVCDSAENLYITGLTNSGSFPVTAPCYQSVKSLYTDMYLSKFSSAGNLIWSTFIGGNDQDDAKALSINEHQDITLFGRTMSTDMTTSPGAVQTTNNGNYDLFITRCDSAGNFFYSGYLGGTNEDDCYEMASDMADGCYLGGGSFSADFPVSATCFQDSIGAVNDGILVKFSLPLNPTLHVAHAYTAPEFIVFPNPANKQVYVSGNQKEPILRISLTDANGKILIKEERGNTCFNTTVNTAGLENGLYFLKIETATSVKTERILIQN